MKLTNIYEAKTNFSKLIEQVIQGKEIIIGKSGKAVARLIPFKPDIKPRRGGQWRGQVSISKDFDEIPEEISAVFRGEKA